MKNIKVYQTNAALGYKQLAFLIRLNKAESGYDYLCIGTQNINDINDTYSYRIGEVVKNLEDCYLEDTTYKVEDSPLFGTYLFDYWLNQYYLDYY